MLNRATIHRTIQEELARRTANLRTIPTMTEWKTSGLMGLEADLALHLESPTPTFELFRSENGREIPWAHEKKTFHGIKQTHIGKV